MTVENQKQLVGRAERVSFPEQSIATHARIDTGARTSAIWGSAQVLPDGALEVFFLGDRTKKHIFKTYGQQVVSNSTGHTEQRHTVRLLVVLKKRRIRGTFTIANRETQVYPVLVGRNVLRGKFVVDVKEGKALVRAEQERIKALQSRLKKDGDS